MEWEGPLMEEAGGGFEQTQDFHSYVLFVRN